MQRADERAFKAKLLLFGEYTIIEGSQALAVPQARYFGEWAWAEKEDRAALQQELPQFAAWLKEKTEVIDSQRFQQDLAQGLYFKSNIPTGYGLGSSGALVAALYERYGVPEKHKSLSELKEILAALEGFFHASSSGIDPFISYLDCPVLRTESGALEALPTLDWPEGFRFFLIDTGKPRKTGPLVQSFLERCESADYLEFIRTTLKPLVGQAIQAFLKGDWLQLWANTGEISRLQLLHFQKMIPAAFLPIWESSLHSDSFRIKLCGAGGGGFLLGLCREHLTPDDLGISHWEWVA